MPQISCLRCKSPIDSSGDSCPFCGERVTLFQRTYAERLIDGKYQILERLGMGGMGEIFKVRHIHLNEQRVIKIMRANIASDEQALQRFLHEARTSTMIKHRNLAMLYDFSTLEDGSYYMVWEYIEGTNIQKWIAKNGPVPPRLTIEIAIQALYGLDHLHGMGLIHRDISPENIMLSSDHQGKLLVKVIDFGIAKQLSEGDSGQGLTQTGMFLGKLKYASPEQAGFLDEGETLDPRSDLYCFGVVLYEMLCGRAPFQASNPHGYILKHATEKPISLSEMNPDIAIESLFEAEVFRALEKNRDHRHRSAADFAARLEAIRDLIPPDERYGLGDWRGTISSERTLVDDTAGGRASTAADTPTMVSGAMPLERADDATLVEQPTGEALRAPTISTRAGHGSSEPTEIGTMIGAAGVAVPEADRAAVGAEPRPSRRGVYLTAAAVVVALLVTALALQLRKKDESAVPQVVTGTQPLPSTTAGETITETAELPAAAEGEVRLVLVAQPYGRVEQLHNKDTNTAVELQDNERWTPFWKDVAPGTYEVVVASPSGKQRKTLEVTLVAGVRPRVPIVKFDAPNIDALTGEILKP